MSLENQWYKHVDKLQRVINSTYQRSIKTTPFELMIGVKMKDNQDLQIKELLEEEIKTRFEESREELRKTAKEQIAKVQEENKKTYNLRRKPPRKYQVNDIVAIKRTQLGPGLKLKVKNNNAYDVRKEGYHDGPIQTSTCAEYIKPWPIIQSDDYLSSETER